MKRQLLSMALVSTAMAALSAPAFAQVVEPATPVPPAGLTAPVDPLAGPTAHGVVTPEEGFVRINVTDVQADDLIGLNLHDAEARSIGSISDLVVTADGRVGQALVDVGGFLGIGARTVAIDFSQIELHRETDGEALRAYVPLTREQVEALPEYTAS